jgi:PAS domain S-box-containing protein
MKSHGATYGVTLAAVCVAGLARWLLDPLLGGHHPFATFFISVIIATWIGGFRSALLATILSILLAWYFFVPPRFSFFDKAVPELIGSAIFLIVGFTIAAFGEAMRVARRRFEELVRQQEPSQRSMSRINDDAVIRKHNMRDVVVIGFLLTLAVLAAGGLSGYMNVRRMADNDRMVAHTHEVIGSLESLLSIIKDAETGQRGYLLTEDEKYLAPYDDALNRVQDKVVHLRGLSADNLDQQARLAVLRQKIDLKVDELRQTVALMRRGDRPAALKIVRSDIGRIFMDDVRQDIAVMQQAEENLLLQRADESEGSYRTAALSILFTATIGIVLVGAVFSLSQRNLIRKQRAAAVLAEQKERLRTTLASIGDAVVTTDAEGCITNMNAVAEALTGWKNDEALGLRLEDVFRIVNEESRQTVANPAKTVLKEGAVVGLANHTVLIAKNGTERPIDDSAAPIRCKDGEVVGCVLVFRDVTERRRRELADRKHHEIFQLVHQIGKIGHWEWNSVTDDNNWSPEIEALYGLPPGGFEGGYAGWAKMLHPDDLPKAEAAVRRAMETGDYFTEFRVIWPDGSIHWLETRAHVFKDGHGKPERIMGVNMDVTERKQAEEKRRESEQRLRFVMDSMPQKIFTAKPNGEVDYFNPVWTEFTGLSFGQIRDWGWTQFIHPGDLPENIRVWQRSIDTGEPFQFEHRFRRADGEYRWHISRAKALKDAEGKVLLWIGSNTDIHEQKQTADQLRKLTADLSEADHRKDEFLATLAHELRNPLAPIRNGLEIMRLSSGSDTAVDPALEEARTMIERQLGQMVHLVDDLLDVSRISRGKLELRKVRSELAAILNSAVETSRPLIDSGGHEITVSLTPEPIFVDADETRLTQVFANLLNNAAKYSDPGGRIWLTAERQGSDVVVSVKDAGIGIPPDMLPKIFEMFTQVDHSLERSRGGLGIGLTLVKRLVESHGGSVEAHSDGQDKGSEFIVRLPVELSMIHEIKPPPVEGRPTCAAGRCRILVADDNEDSATTLAIMLEIMGNEVRTAKDGLQAVNLAAAFHPDVIFLDIGMPKLNGYEACRRIREQPWATKAVLVALTGWGQEEDRRRSEEAGFNHHIVKPIMPAVIEKLLAEMSMTPA